MSHWFTATPPTADEQTALAAIRAATAQPEPPADDDEIYGPPRRVRDDPSGRVFWL